MSWLSDSWSQDLWGQCYDVFVSDQVVTSNSRKQLDKTRNLIASSSLSLVAVLPRLTHPLPSTSTTWPFCATAEGISSTSLQLSLSISKPGTHQCEVAFVTIFLSEFLGVCISDLKQFQITDKLNLQRPCVSGRNHGIIWTLIDGIRKVPITTAHQLKCMLAWPQDPWLPSCICHGRPCYWQGHQSSWHPSGVSIPHPPWWRSIWCWGPKVPWKHLGNS